MVHIRPQMDMYSPYMNIYGHIWSIYDHICPYMVGACVSGAECVHDEERVGCLMAGVAWRGMGLHGVVWRMVWHGVA